MKLNINYLICSILLTAMLACSENEYDFKYPEAIATTEVGTYLVENTDIISTIFSDSSYAVVDGFDITEINYLSMEGYAMHLFIAEVDLRADGISIHACTPDNGYAFKRQKMSEQVVYNDDVDAPIWGAVNADFFNMSTGVPYGIVHKQGVAVKSTFSNSGANWFAINNDNKAMIGNEEEYEEVKSELRDAIGGRVMLVKDGVNQITSTNSKEPRTSIGISEDGNSVYILVVDGRYFSYSSGMNYLDMAKVMMALGAHDAINLDGGGSTTLIKRTTPEFTDDRFELVNHPSDNGGYERAVANGLTIVKRNQ